MIRSRLSLLCVLLVVLQGVSGCRSTPTPTPAPAPVPVPAPPQDVNANDGALLYNAILDRHDDVVEDLLKKGADPNLREDYLANAVMNKRNSTALLLLKYGADPNKARGVSVLYYAAGDDNIELMKALLEHGADVNYNDYVGGGTPIVSAVEDKRFAAAQMLLEHGADPSIRVKFHDTPWETARQNKDTEMLELLDRYRANCKEEPDRCK